MAEAEMIMSTSVCTLSHFWISNPLASSVSRIFVQSHPTISSRIGIKTSKASSPRYLVPSGPGDLLPRGTPFLLLNGTPDRAGADAPIPRPAERG